MNPDFAAHLLSDLQFRYVISWNLNSIFYKMGILRILSAEMEEVGGE